jgi:hypothetical protein
MLKNNIINNFFRLPSSKKGLLIKSIILTIFIRLSISLLSFSNVQKISNKISHTKKTRTSNVNEIIWSVRVASCYVPHTTCLTQAITAKTLLSRNNYNSKLRIGVIKEDNFKAHAWIEINDKIVLGELEQDYVPILNVV